jgi:DNA-directed RNA polymerase specialized sigma24 family protein
LTQFFDDGNMIDMGETPHPSHEGHERPPATLSDVLYANKTKPRVSEQEWVELVRAIAGRDLHALDALYTRTRAIVFTLIMRIVAERVIAEALTIEVFNEVWRTASTYSPSRGSVVGWLMNRAYYLAIGRLRFQQLMERVKRSSVTAVPPPDVLQPFPSIWERLVWRLTVTTGQGPLLPAPEPLAEPEWEDVAPGIACKLLATDTENDRVSMLVRLAPGAAYPPHTHAGVEELYLLHGQLIIDGRTLYPGDYNRGESGACDQLVWSETGCTCVLLTSTRDVLH